MCLHALPCPALPPYLTHCIAAPLLLCVQLYHNMPTHMAPTGGAPCVILGLTGFTKKTIAQYVKEDPLYADSQPLTAAEKAPPAPIIINFVFQQCQASFQCLQLNGQAGTTKQAMGRRGLWWDLACAMSLRTATALI